MSKTTWLIAAVTSFVAAFAGVASAQGYPDRPIRLVVPATAGDGSDFIARLLGAELSKLLKQPVIIENKPGASGEIAAGEVARTAADGYTLLFANTSIFVANKYMYPKSHEQELVPIIHLTETPFILLGAPEFRDKTLAEVLALARASKKPFLVGAAATPFAMAIALLREASGVELETIAYKSNAQAMVDLSNGGISLMVESVVTGAPRVSDGKLAALAVTSENRLKTLPTVPTMKESGINFTFGAWTMIGAPKGTPADVVSKINQAMNTALTQNPEIRQRLGALGTELVGGTPEKVDQSVQQERKRLGAIITKFNLKP